MRNGKLHSADVKAHPIEYGSILLGTILAVICALGILRGFNWARWVLVLFYGYRVFGKLILPSNMPLSQRIIGAALFAVAIYYLFRPRANAFFRGVSAAEPTPHATI